MDHPFRLVLPMMLYHRLQAHTGETLDRRQEGLPVLITLRPVGFAMMAGLIAYMVNPESMAWSSFGAPAWLRWVGAGIGVLAAAMLLWTLRNLGKNLTDTVVTRRLHTMVSSGPYRWVRHPFYIGVTLAIVANGLVAANWFILGAGAVVVTLLVLRTRTEEKNLLERFGESYREYMERTGRFVPKINFPSG